MPDNATTTPSSATMDWGDLGVGEDGLPVHLPLPCNEQGQGPVEANRALTWHCWCGTDCLLDQVLRQAWRSGLRIGRNT